MGLETIAFLRNAWVSNMGLWLKAMKSVNCALLGKLPITICICIVGSRKLNSDDNYITYPWSLLSPNLKVYGIDADPKACELANAYVELLQVDWEEKHFPVAVSSFKGKRKFYQTLNPNCSSILPPNPYFVNRIFQMKEGFEVINTLEVDVITLDDFCLQSSIGGIDFLQTDVQGADLDVLNGAVRQLSSSIIGLMIEVLFTPLYQLQPVFSDIDKCLQEYGFQLFDLEMQDAWCRLQRNCSPVKTSRRGQLLWADAYYFKDPLLVTGLPEKDSLYASSMTPEQIFKLTCLADILGFDDFSLELLEHLTSSFGIHDERYNFSRLIVETLEKLFPDQSDSFPIVSRMKIYFHS